MGTPPGSRPEMQLLQLLSAEPGFSSFLYFSTKDRIPFTIATEGRKVQRSARVAGDCLEGHQAPAALRPPPASRVPTRLCPRTPDPVPHIRPPQEQRGPRSQRRPRWAVLLEGATGTSAKPAQG